MNEEIIDRRDGCRYEEENENKSGSWIEKTYIKVVSGISISAPLVCVVEVCLALRCGVVLVDGSFGSFPGPLKIDDQGPEILSGL
jgi:hypothetical protein